MKLPLQMPAVGRDRRGWPVVQTVSDWSRGVRPATQQCSACQSWPSGQCECGKPYTCSGGKSYSCCPPYSACVCVNGNVECIPV